MGALGRIQSALRLLQGLGGISEPESSRNRTAMAVTRSQTSQRAEIRRSRGSRFAWRRSEFAWTLAAALLVGAGLYQVYKAKSQPFEDLAKGLTAKSLLDLNAISAREDLDSVLSRSPDPMFPDPAERDFVARKIYYVSGGLSNVGAIARIRVTASEVGHGRGLKDLRDRLAGRDSMPLLTAAQVRELKTMLVVRTPGSSGARLSGGPCVFFAAFLLAHFWWSIRGFRGDQLLLPAVLLLTGAGLILMIALRDPVRDNLLFADFAQGVAGGRAAAGGERPRFRTPAGKVELRSAARQLRALRAADPVRIRPGHERRQGQPAGLSAGRTDSPPAGAVPGGLFRAAAGTCCATPAKRAPRWPR